MTARPGRRSNISATHSLVNQVLPRYRQGSLEVALDYDPDVSCDHFIMTFRRYCPSEEDAVEDIHRICRALALDRNGQDKLTYVREICTMVSPALQHGYTLEDLKPVFASATQKWDLLATFLALDDFLKKQATRYHMASIQNSRNFTVQQDVNTLLAALRLNGKTP